MCSKSFSLDSDHLAVVGTGHGNLQKADREMLCCDNITVGAVLAAHLSLSTDTLHVFSHGAAPYSLTTTKGARQEDVVTLPLVRIKMALEVPHLSCPPTAFPVVLTVYPEVIDLALEELVEARAGQNIRFATLRVLLLVACKESCATLLTNMMTTVVQEWVMHQSVTRSKWDRNDSLEAQLQSGIQLPL